MPHDDIHEVNCTTGEVTIRKPTKAEIKEAEKANAETAARIAAQRAEHEAAAARRATVITTIAEKTGLTTDEIAEVIANPGVTPTP